jgi:2'-5' RNA ligase
MQQSHLPGFAPPAREIHNLFFALWPDEATRARIAAAADRLRREQAPQGRWIRPERYHLTLEFLGEHAAFPAALAERAAAAAGEVQAEAFALDLDVAGSFANAKIPCWFGCRTPPPGLLRLHERLRAALAAHGCRVARAPLVPHVTILRDADRRLQAELPAPLRWAVGEFVLVDSRTQPFAPYRVLGRWPLR